MTRQALGLTALLLLGMLVAVAHAARPDSPPIRKPSIQKTIKALAAEVKPVRKNNWQWPDKSEAATEAAAAQFDRKTILRALAGRSLHPEPMTNGYIKYSLLMLLPEKGKLEPREVDALSWQLPAIAPYPQPDRRLQSLLLRYRKRKVPAATIQQLTTAQAALKKQTDAHTLANKQTKAYHQHLLKNAPREGGVRLTVIIAIMEKEYAAGYTEMSRWTRQLKSESEKVGKDPKISRDTRRNLSKRMTLLTKHINKKVLSMWNTTADGTLHVTQHSCGLSQRSLQNNQQTLEGRKNLK